LELPRQDRRLPDGFIQQPVDGRLVWVHLAGPTPPLTPGSDSRAPDALEAARRAEAKSATEDVVIADADNAPIVPSTLARGLPLTAQVAFEKERLQAPAIQAGDIAP
jgi:hypothetical protein